VHNSLDVILSSQINTNNTKQGSTVLSAAHSAPQVTIILWKTFPCNDLYSGVRSY